MKTTITILCENSVGVPFGAIGEHGFSCFIETESGNYLFDTGQGFGIIQNALMFQKDLRSIKSLSISHGHYDHTGGLPAVLKMTGEVDVYAHPDIFMDRTISFLGVERFIGIPFRRRFLESMGANFLLDEKLREIGPGVFLTGEIPRTNDFEKGDANMSAITETGEKLTPDPIKDDNSLVIDSDKGLIIVLGCAHAGMVNILDYVLKEMNRDSIYAVIGGTHLGFAGPEQFRETLKAIDKYKIERLGVSHCTGLMQASMLHEKLKERFFFGCVGSILEG